MPKGGRFVTLFYPGRIAIPEHSAFPVSVDGKHASVLLYRHFSSVEALDFNNAISREVRDGVTDWCLERPITMPERDRIALDSNGELIYVFEDGVQYYRLIKPRPFTELFIQYDVEDTANLTDEEKTRHGQVLERFISAYRAFTGDVTIRMPNDLAGDYPVVRAGVREYTEEELQLSEIDRLTRLHAMDVRVEGMPWGTHPALLTPPSIDPERVGPTITRFLASGGTVPAAQAILIQALEALKISQDYRHALLLAFFSIEQVVTETLEDVKKNAGIPEKTIKNFRAGEFGVSYRINIEVPLVFPPGSPIRNLIPDLDKANTYRNGVVHKQRDPTYDEAAFVIKTADRLIKALSGEPIDCLRTAEPVQPSPGRA